MQRYKSFVATGQAPNGRLYAGDLNAIQDAAAAVSDYAQQIDLSVLTVGDSSLQILKYGTGEFRFTGAARVDGILRGLGGLYAGQFTTTQRDAIPSGSRPYGLTIFNVTTNRLETNKGSDASPSWQPATGLKVRKASGTAYTRGGISFIEGTGITLTVVDDSANDEVDVTINASSQSIHGLVPIGGTVPYGGDSDPPDFLICDGRMLDTTTYSALFAVIGYKFGGSGSTFRIPNFQSAIPWGWYSVGVPIGSYEYVSWGSGYVLPYTLRRIIMHYVIRYQ